MSNESAFATTVVANAINELLTRNQHTKGRDVAEMWVGPTIFVARLREWKTVDSTCVDVPRRTDEADLFDLMDEHKRRL